MSFEVQKLGRCLVLTSKTYVLLTHTHVTRGCCDALKYPTSLYLVTILLFRQGMAMYSMAIWTGTAM